jgi:hypothetical protein
MRYRCGLTAKRKYDIQSNSGQREKNSMHVVEVPRFSDIEVSVPSSRSILFWRSETELMVAEDRLLRTSIRVPGHMFVYTRFLPYKFYGMEGSTFSRNHSRIEDRTNRTRIMRIALKVMFRSEVMFRILEGMFQNP